MMEKTTYSPEFLQRRKFYTVLPILALPFLTFLYYLLVVKDLEKKDGSASGSTGLNLSLPDPLFKNETAMTKLSYYEKAELDSAKRHDQIRKDPYLNELPSLSGVDSTGVPLQGLDGPFGKYKKNNSYHSKASASVNESKVYGKLKELDAVLAASGKPAFKDANDGSNTASKGGRGAEHPDIKKLEAMMESLHQESLPEQPQDPEMQQINAMLEKILEIQHPERAAVKIQQQSENSKKLVLPVSVAAANLVVTCLDCLPDSVSGKVQDQHYENAGFFSLTSDVSPVTQNAIRAEIDQDQTIVPGSTVKLRLTCDVYIAGMLIAAGSNLYGIASINSERLSIEIQSVRKDNSILSVQLSAYDLDGIQGLYVPGAISRDVAKQSLSQDIQSLNIGTLDPSIGAQAATAGIQAAKTLMGRKARQIKVHLKAGYQVLLVDSNAKTI